MTNQEQRQTPDARDNIAAGYDKFVTPTHMGLGNEALSRVGLAKGMRFLDVACGSGALSIPAARLGAQVLSVDLSPAMGTDHCACTQEGLSNLEGRVMDGHALELEDDAFGVSGSQYGIMLFPDLPRALRDLVRVTKPGGRVLVVVRAAAGSRVSKLLPGRREGCGPWFHRPPNGSSSSALPGGGP